MQIGCIVAYYHCKATNKNLDMKTISKHYQCEGNVVLIQLESVEGEGFGFRTATAAMNDGGLLVKEVRQEGSVNTLLAMNQTGDYLLLTDMDLLKGAKQNRVVNTSVLIAPHSKREIDVSCVERSRWSYDSPTFEPAPSTMDSKMRAAKAHSLRDDIKHKSSGTQSKIWGMINDELRAYNMDSPSEDYNSILESKAKREVVQHRFDLKNGCNGLAVFDGKKLVAFDIFGNRDVYQHYFDQLSRDALGRFRDGAEEKAIEQAEAFYRLDEFLDAFESQLEDPSEKKQGAIGKHRWSADPNYPGFDLSFEGQAVHMAGFAVD